MESCLYWWLFFVYESHMIHSGGRLDIWISASVFIEHIKVCLVNTFC